MSYNENQSRRDKININNPRNLSDSKLYSQIIAHTPTQQVVPRAQIETKAPSGVNQPIYVQNSAQQPQLAPQQQVVNTINPASQGAQMAATAGSGPGVMSNPSGLGPNGQMQRFPAHPNSYQPHVTHQHHAQRPATHHQRQGPMMHGRPQMATSQSMVPQAGPVQNVAQQSGIQQHHVPHQHYVYHVTPNGLQPQAPVVVNSQHNMASHIQFNQQRLPYNQVYPQIQFGYVPGYQQPYVLQYSTNQQQITMPQQMQPRGAPPQVPQTPPNISTTSNLPMNPANNEVTSNDSMIHQPPVPPPKTTLVKRERKPLAIVDPTTGQALSENFLKSSIPAAEENTASSNNSQSRSSSQRETPPQQSTSNKDVDNSVALQFAYQVAQVAMPSASSDNSASTTNSLSETSEVKNDEKCDDSSKQILTDETDASSLKNEKLPISAAVNSESVNATESSSESSKSSALFSNRTCKDNICEPVSEIIRQNGEASDGTISPASDSSAKDGRKQSERQRKKEMIKKADARKDRDDLEDIKVEEKEPSSAVTTSATQHVSSQPSTPSEVSMPEESIPVTHPSVEAQAEVKEENEVEKKNEENTRLCQNNNEAKIEPEVTEANECLNQTNKPAIPKLPYGPQQWRPDNPSGKKQYSREFLISLQKTETSLKKPDNLPKLDIVHNEPHVDDYSSRPSPISDDPFFPTFISQGKHTNYPPRPIPNRRSQKREQIGRKVIPATSLTQDVKLHTTDKAWKPPMKTGAEDSADSEETETLELLKKVRGILNKLTPQKYDALKDQILSFKLDTEDRLRRILDLIFEKAVDEPAFCIQYANLCKELAKVEAYVNKEDPNSDKVKFQKLLLSKCQKEFEANIYQGIDIDGRQEEIERETDPEKHKFLKEVLDDEMRRARKRSLGNVKLIGELYKLHMLRGNIMLACMEKLCSDHEDESLECLCALLKTIGEQIEDESNQMKDKISDKKKGINISNILNQFFKFMDDIANQRHPEFKTSSRVRFMLQDVIELRANKWKPRRDESGPKKIDDIHKEAREEQIRQAQELQQHAQQKRLDDRTRKGRAPNAEEGGNWKTINTRKSQTQASSQGQSMDWNKFTDKMKESLSANNEVQLGPSSLATNWSQGSRGGAQMQSRSAGDDNRNRFSALTQADSRKTQKSSSTIGNRDSSKGRSNHSGYIGSRSSQNERQSAINSVRHFIGRPPQSETPPFASVQRSDSRPGSREQSAPSSRNSSVRRQTPDSIETNRLRGSNLNLSEDELSRKAKEMIKEYLQINSLNDALEDVKEAFSSTNVHFYVSSAINHALEVSSQKDHFAIGLLFCTLVVKMQLVEENQFIKGLHSIMDLAEDIAIDVPKFWDYMGELLAEIFIELPAERRKDFFKRCFKPCQEKSGKLIVKVISAVAKLTSQTRAHDLWHESELQFSDFEIDSEDVELVVNENNIDFILKRPEELLPMSSVMLTKLKKEVAEMVKRGSTKEELQEYIKKHFDDSTTTNPDFTSALFIAIVNGCIFTETISGEEVSNYSFSENEFEDKAPLLSKYISGNQDLELRALLELQQFVNDLEHPRGLLVSIFKVLANCEVISQEGFLQWEKCETNVPGKAVAVKSTTSFFTWLRENESEDESDS